MDGRESLPKDAIHPDFSEYLQVPSPALKAVEGWERHEERDSVPVIR